MNFTQIRNKKYSIALTSIAVLLVSSLLIPIEYASSTTTFANSFSVDNEDVQPRSVFLNPDGTKMYVLGSEFNLVYEYDLTTAFDVTTADFLQSTGAGDATPNGLFFNSDGTKMYVPGDLNDAIKEFDLDPGFDVSTSAELQAKNVGLDDTQQSGVFFNPDGTKMYYVGSQKDLVHEYDLDPGFDITTADVLQTFDVGDTSGVDIPIGLAFSLDGTKMFVTGRDTNQVHQYSLSTAFDVTSAVLDDSLDVVAQDNLTHGVAFSFNGKKMYVAGDQNDKIYEYKLEVAFDLFSSPSFIASLPTTPSATPSSLNSAF